MQNKKTIFLSALIAISIFSAFPSASKESIQAAEIPANEMFPDPPAQTLAENPGTAVAVLAGGCFWGVEAVFEELKGVKDVVSGYSGGSKETAEYHTVGSGTTGHAESVRIEYDPSVITFGTLLKIFFHVAHDPTELNYQGPDRGTQYRSVIFYMNDEQKNIADQYIAILDNAGVFPDKIVTELHPFEAFYPAEDYHQNFMMLNPDYPYIVYWDRPKVEFLESEYPEFLKD